MNENFECIVEQNAIFLNIVKKSMVENFTESEYIRILSLKFKKDLKVKKIDTFFSHIIFFNEKNNSQKAILTDKKNVRWEFVLEKNKAELNKVYKTYGDFFIEYNDKSNHISSHKPEAMFHIEFNDSVINKELVDMIAITTDFDVKNLLGVGTDFFMFSKENEKVMEKNKNKKLANTIKYKIKRLFS